MPDPRFATLRLDTGPTIHDAEQGCSDGVPMVLLHGWPDSWFSYSRVMPLLAPAIRAFALDQRGFGDSRLTDGEVGMDDFADDVVAFLDALSIERAVVVGHSFGSFVARHLVARYPERVIRLVLIGTGFTAANAVTREVQEAMRTLPDPVPAAFARDFQAGSPNWERPERVAADLNDFVDPP